PSMQVERAGGLSLLQRIQLETFGLAAETTHSVNVETFPPVTPILARMQLESGVAIASEQDLQLEASSPLATINSLQAVQLEELSVFVLGQIAQDSIRSCNAQTS